MENVGEYLRGNMLSASVWDSYDEILATCAETWNWLMADPGRVRSIGAREWATVNVSGRWYNLLSERAIHV